VPCQLKRAKTYSDFIKCKVVRRRRILRYAFYVLFGVSLKKSRYYIMMNVVVASHQHPVILKYFVNIMKHYTIHVWKQFFGLQESDVDHPGSAEYCRRILHTQRFRTTSSVTTENRDDCHHRYFSTLDIDELEGFRKPAIQKRWNIH